ncbi:hypothetical protein EDC04DRAFT_2600796 [Pisolithus marmoratus]|nr:hypothetical protein EDC04DRAFT_2600796 [Pisolithus marmoratus]
MCECLHSQSLADNGSENNANEGDKEDYQSGIDNKDTQWRQNLADIHVKEQVTYHDNENTRATSVAMETCEEMATMNKEAMGELHQTLYHSSNDQLGKHKIKEMHVDHRSQEVEDSTCMMPYAVHAKRHLQPAADKLVPVIIVKAHSLRMKVTLAQWTMMVLPKAPMPDHTQETSLLNVSQARACQITGMNLAHTPQLVKPAKICPPVEVVNGFQSSQSKLAIRKNWILAEELKEGINFAFKSSMLQLKRIDSYNDGVIFPDHFQAISIPSTQHWCLLP